MNTLTMTQPMRTYHKVRVPFCLAHRWVWYTWDVDGDDIDKAILEKAKQLNAQAWNLSLVEITKGVK